MATQPTVPASLHLIIRFGGQPLPDMRLAIPNPSSTPISTLKSRIRVGLPSTFADHGIKLIYNGRQLRNQVNVLQELFPRGLQGMIGVQEDVPIYVHCALPLAKDQVFESKEARLAFEDWTAVIQVADDENDGEGVQLGTYAQAAQQEQDVAVHGSNENPSTTSPSTSSTATPHITATTRGFDRLLSIPSFTAPEISALRAQFRANIAARHTPVTMPSEIQLLQMEERWLDGSAFSSSLPPVAAADLHASTLPSSNTLDSGPAAPVANVSGRNESNALFGAALTNATTDGFNTGQQLAAAASTTFGSTFGTGTAAFTATTSPPVELEPEDDAARALDDTLLGVVTGFFWPIGAVVWGLREEGVWSRRRGWSVLAGVMVNVAFGVVRVMG